jgi:DNA-binding MarR family transcriptional regulator/GNAT superfamily N-acetyltransferase
MPAAVPGGRIAAVRRFNRFYTRHIGVLGETMLDSPFSLTEARILYELAQGDRPTASALCEDLGLDAGYASRILTRFARAGLVRRVRSKTDGRQSLIALTPRGRKAFAPLERQSAQDVAGLLRPLPADKQCAVVDAMRTIERLLAPGSAPTSPPRVRLRPPQPGDMGWVVSRHGALYAQEYRFDATFEALVAEIVADFVKGFDPARERCWIAEQGGENAGSAFVVRGSDTAAKLRLLLVEPSARGLGIGKALVSECLAFARASGYRRMTLWTQQNLVAARRVYEASGFVLVKAEPHRSFGQDLIGETWELAL